MWGLKGKVRIRGEKYRNTKYMLGYGFTFMDSNNTLLSTNDRFFRILQEFYWYNATGNLVVGFHNIRIRVIFVEKLNIFLWDHSGLHDAGVSAGAPSPPWGKNGSQCKFQKSKTKTNFVLLVLSRGFNYWPIYII